MEAAAVQSFGKVGKFEQRRTFTYEGRDIYEWEQSMQEVLVYLTPPAAVTADMIDCKITVQRLVIGLKGNPPFLDVSEICAKSSCETITCVALCRLNSDSSAPSMPSPST